MNKEEKLYMTQEDLYRIGNSTSPQILNPGIGEITIMDLGSVDIC